PLRRGGQSVSRPRDDSRVARSRRRALRDLLEREVHADFTGWVRSLVYLGAPDRRSVGHDPSLPRLGSRRQGRCQGGSVFGVSIVSTSSSPLSLSRYQLNLMFTLIFS